MAWSFLGNAHGTAHHRIDCVYARREGTLLVLTAHRLLDLLAAGKKSAERCGPTAHPSGATGWRWSWLSWRLGRLSPSPGHSALSRPRCPQAPIAPRTHARAAGGM